MIAVPQRRNSLLKVLHATECNDVFSAKCAHIIYYAAEGYLIIITNA